MGHEQREAGQEMRRRRISVMGRVADQLSKLLVELGPAHAVTIAFTMPAVEQESEQAPWATAECYAYSGYIDPDVGAAHFAKVSDVMEGQHVKLQREIDEYREKERQAAAAAEDMKSTPPGVAVEHEGEGS